MKSHLRRSKASKSTLRKVEAIARRGHRQTRRALYAGNRLQMAEGTGLYGQ